MDIKTVSSRFAVAGLALIAGLSARADVRLPGLFSSNMVLQHGVRAPIWGWADDGEEVVVTFQDQKVKTKAKHGQWMVHLKKLDAGGPDELTVSGRNVIVLKNVLVGEVWIASGQSNMEWPLSRAFEPKADIDSAANPNLRLFTAPKLKAEKPVTDVKSAWQQCNPQTVPGFSAVAYYFARALQKELKVPVGIIHTSWGGSPAEVWMSEKTLAANPAHQKDIVEKYQTDLKNYQAALEKFNKEQAELKSQGKTSDRRAPSAPWKPTELYNGMIAPLIPYAIKGGIWYQGESNAGRAHQYRTLFADMIRNWRRDWGQGDFPFLQVQLAPFKKIQPQPVESDWAELREAQFLATKILPKVGMAVITDVGEENDIHPQKKGPVGERLALAARGIAYGEKLVYSGPIYKSMKIKGDKIVLAFDHVGNGLEARGGDLKGFAVAGEDRKFVWAKAEIQPDSTVAVSSPVVPKPVAARFGWADFPVVNLWNKNGLPATPFRTDDFPMVTQPKK